MSHYLDVLQNLAVFLERYTSHVQRLAGYRNLLAALLIAHERNDQHVLAVLDIDGEVSLLVGHGSGNEFCRLTANGRGLLDADVREVHRLLRAEINHSTGYLYAEGDISNQQETKYVPQLLYIHLFRAPLSCGRTRLRVCPYF